MQLDPIDWQRVGQDMETLGHARLGRQLDEPTCAWLARLRHEDGVFRRRIVMERHAYGVGSYAYFDRPLPEPVDRMRRDLYGPLARIADEMMARLGRDRRFPPDLDGFLAECRMAGQTLPTPLLLHYDEDGWNALHRDLYGDIAFPLQVVVMLSRPDRDFEGGEFLLVERRPRMMSRGEAIRLEQGEALVFPTAERAVHGRRGWTRAEVRHGVSRVRRGSRTTLGIIFHDAA